MKLPRMLVNSLLMCEFLLACDKQPVHELTDSDNSDYVDCRVALILGNYRLME